MDTCERLKVREEMGTIDKLELKNWDTTKSISMEELKLLTFENLTSSKMAKVILSANLKFDNINGGTYNRKDSIAGTEEKDKIGDTLG